MCPQGLLNPSGKPPRSGISTTQSNGANLSRIPSAFIMCREGGNREREREGERERGRQQDEEEGEGKE